MAIEKTVSVKDHVMAELQERIKLLVTAVEEQRTEIDKLTSTMVNTPISLARSEALSTASKCHVPTVTPSVCSFETFEKPPKQKSVMSNFDKLGFKLVDTS